MHPINHLGNVLCHLERKGYSRGGNFVWLAHFRTSGGFQKWHKEGRMGVKKGCVLGQVFITSYSQVPCTRYHPQRDGVLLSLLDCHPCLNFHSLTPWRPRPSILLSSPAMKLSLYGPITFPITDRLVVSLFSSTSFLVLHPPPFPCFVPLPRFLGGACGPLSTPSDESPKIQNHCSPPSICYLRHWGGRRLCFHSSVCLWAGYFNKLWTDSDESWSAAWVCDEHKMIRC